MYILTSKQITEVSNVEKEEKEEIRRVDRDSKLVKMHTHGGSSGKGWVLAQ